ncbi:MAG: NlpC/P60 family protein, partial [Lachnospiraceae bacterium]|nr:NlpC/P60 family protein [Lachnospiraceae bacterium]
EPSSESVTVIRRNTVPEDTSFASPGDTGTPDFAEADPASGTAASASASKISASDIASNSNAEARFAHPTEADSSLEDESETKENSLKHAEHSHENCPGHVDLYIQVKLLGLNDRNGLISIDAIGNDPDSITADGWQGWTEETLSYVNAISSQDWFADYGLSISAISLSTPLSNQEIADYMDQLPKDLSEARREIIHFALSSVGRVPYYWGGKASHAGYEGNQFGALVPPDHEGRILKGLDCSGWIDWVYWSATGKRLAGSSTSSLILCGEKISRSDLKPGDIIVRTGTSAHVVMFLSWSADGRMNVIHESSASVNNVTIKTMDAAWPYYRKLVD